MRTGPKMYMALNYRKGRRERDFLEGWNAALKSLKLDKQAQKKNPPKRRAVLCTTSLPCTLQSSLGGVCESKFPCQWQDRKTTVCYRCNGRGEVYQQGERAPSTCPDCRGSGKRSTIVGRKHA